MARRVLMISRAFYPNNASGSHRAAKLAKYLSRFGWEPTVVCPDWNVDNSRGCYDAVLAGSPEVCETVRVPYHSGGGGLVSRFCSRVGPALMPYRYPLRLCRSMCQVVEQLAASRQSVDATAFDAVWSTYTPGLDHYVASRVRQKYRIPWVADFRDLPDQTYDNWQIRRMVRAELRHCQRADAIVTTSSTLAGRLATRHHAPVHVILNGFDRDDFSVEPGGLSEEFTIRHFGTLYEFRDPRPLFEALDRLVDDGEIDLDNVRVQFHGADKEAVASLSRGFRCEQVVQSFDRAVHRDMTVKQQTAQLLLLLKSADAGGPIPAKLFDYLAAGRVILNVPGDGDCVDDILQRTQAGVSVAEPAAIAKVILRWYRQWQSDGKVLYEGVAEQVETYSRKRQAGELAAILDSIAGEG